MDDRKRPDIAAIWPALDEADRKRNAGMPMEFFIGEVYAERDGVSLEEYVISTMRAERERRQAVERIAAAVAELRQE